MILRMSGRGRLSRRRLGWGEGNSDGTVQCGWRWGGCAEQVLVGTRVLRRRSTQEQGRRKSR